MDDQDRGTASTDAGASDTVVERSFIGRLRARDVDLSESAVGLVALEGDLSVSRGGCGPVFAGGDVSISYGGCGPMIAGGDVSIEYGGTQSILAGGVATIGSGGLVGFVLSPSVTVADGGKVLLSTRQALAFGAAVGLAWALLSRVVRR